MTETVRLILLVLVMAGVTYLIRMLPFTLFRKKIRSKFVRNFLSYIPYAVIATMTVPHIFFSTESLYAALAGTAAAVVFALRDKSLTAVAVAACTAALAVNLLLAAF